MKAIYIGDEFPEFQGLEVLVDTDLYNDNHYIIKVGMDWVPQIPSADLEFIESKN